MTEKLLRYIRTHSCGTVINFQDKYCRKCGEYIELSPPDYYYLCFMIDTLNGKFAQDYPSVSQVCIY